MPVGEQIAILYCGTNGLLRDVPVTKVREFEEMFLQEMRRTHQSDVLDHLQKGEIDDTIKATLKETAAKIAEGFKQ